MKTDLKRREFLSKVCNAGIACCALMMAPKAFGSQNSMLNYDDEIDPKKLEYCGYKCPVDCPLRKATAENNTEARKKVYESAKMKEKYGVDFDPNKIFCYGCKVTDKPLGINVKNCTVRNCAVSKGYDGCIQCADLVSCKKELWDNFPKFKDKVIEMQKKYKGKAV